MKVIKRDGRAVEYNSDKICIAIEKANQEVIEEKRATKQEIKQITNYIESLDKKRILVEDIQDVIEQKLMELGRYDLAKKYIVYRYTRALVRKQSTTDESILGLIRNIGNGTTTSEQGYMNAAVQRNLIAGEVSKDLTKRILLPDKITKAHEDGVLYFHAMEYFLQPIINTCFVNINDILENGTTINNQKIDAPQNFIQACSIFAQVVAAVTNSQYGKQYINVKYLGKYLRKSYEKINDELKDLQGNGSISEDILKEHVQRKLKEELFEGIQIMKYQMSALTNTYEKKSFIGLIMFDNKEDEYYKENELIFSEILEQKIRNCEYITNILDIEKYQYEGLFNYGIVSINLPQVALSIDGEEDCFWRLLDERLDICYEALMCRHYALLGTVSDVSPIHWQNGAITRLESGEKIDKLLKDGYSNITLRIFWLI